MKLVILDLDGVILDSEFAVSEITAELATKAGAPVSARQVFQSVSGMGSRQKFQAIAAAQGICFADTTLVRLSMEHERRKSALYTGQELRTVDGAKELIASLLQERFTLAVATNGKADPAAQALGRVGLLDAFEGRIYTPENVGGRKKPDPALICHILVRLGVDPADAAGIDDSPVGVAAFCGAGVKVLAFLDDRLGSALPAREAEMRTLGAVGVIRRMSEAQSVFPRLFPPG